MMPERGERVTMADIVRAVECGATMIAHPAVGDRIAAHALSEGVKLQPWQLLVSPWIAPGCLGVVEGELQETILRAHGIVR